MPIAYFRDAAGWRWTITPSGFLDHTDLDPGDRQIPICGATKEAQRLRALGDNN